MEISKEQLKEVFNKAAKTSRKLTDPTLYLPIVHIKEGDIKVSISLHQVLSPEQFSHGYRGLSLIMNKPNYDYYMEVNYVGKLCTVKDEKIKISEVEYTLLKNEYKHYFDILNAVVIKRKSALKDKGVKTLLSYINK